MKRITPMVIPAFAATRPGEEKAFVGVVSDEAIVESCVAPGRMMGE
ncbi:MAG: hypothetical protein ABSH30_10680 [Acidimicrobiales bacterium]